MRTRIAILILLFAIGCCFAGPAASAQSCGGDGHLQTQTWWTTDGAWPDGWFYYSAYPGTYVYVIASWGGSCPPVSHCSDCDKGGGTAGHPINLTNGNTFIDETDVRVPGLGTGLRLDRRWNSLWPPILQGAPQTGMFGFNWRSTYEERVFPGSGDAVNYTVYAQANGSVSYFSSLGGSNWKMAAPASTTATMTQSGTGPWTLTFQNGEQRVFDYSTGLLTKIIDRNGNTTQLTYTGTQLTSVADAAGRHLYFTYSTGSPALVTAVTTDVGISLSYSYDTQNRLTQVTKPDLTTISFTYNSQSLISSVLDTNGNVLESHTYDSSGRGTSSSRASGVEAVTISYH